MVLTPLFPFLPPTYQIEGIATTETEIIVQARSRRTSACCPHCGMLSRWWHSAYQRHLWHQPTAGHLVHLRVVVHRFRCHHAACEAATFAEPLEDLAERSARRTQAQEQAIQRVGLALGGRAGARLAAALGLAGASPATLLRHLRRVTLPEQPPLRVVGLDDWLIGQPDRVGAILVDLERHQVVDLLPDYSTETLVAWLRQHPQVQILVRDRSPIGRAAATRGAPQAQQVVDRFHLLKNLGEQVTAGFYRHPARPPRSPPPPSEGCESSQQVPPTPLLAKEQGYAQMQALRAAGYSIRAIASQLSYTRETVHRWLSQGPPQAGWAGQVRRSRGSQQPRSALPSAPQAARLFLRPAQQLSASQEEQLRQVLSRQAELEPIYQLTQRFVRLLAERDVAALEAWIAQASSCSWSQLRTFARGLREEVTAVQAALTSPYSNGPVEGLITRLKLLKRQGYGRASVELLRTRLLASV